MLSFFVSHFVADFLCQTDEMAVNKSTSNYHLIKHGCYYTMGFAVTALLLLILAVMFPVLTPFVSAFTFKYLILNGVLHTIVDYGTSRWTSYLWKKEERHNFFSVIGLDQCIHMTILYLTFFIC